MSHQDKLLKGFEELVTMPKKRTIPMKIAQAGVVTVAGLMVCTGFGLMCAVRPLRKENRRK